jgi:hypothetical protein
LLRGSRNASTYHWIFSAAKASNCVYLISIGYGRKSKLETGLEKFSWFWVKSLR